MQHPSYVLIPLRRRDGTIRAHAIIDASDRRLAAHRWFQMAKGYAARNVVHPNGTRGLELLHRAVMGLAYGDPREVDHRDRDPLNCRRSNMRIATRTINTQNVRSQRGSTSRYRGVHWSSRSRRWIARAHIDGRTHHVGAFVDERAAGRAARAFRLAHMPGALD